MANLHLIGGEKGGVGKSFTARLLAQYFIDHELPFAGFDTDESHRTFSRFYGEYTAPVQIHDFDSLDHIIEFAEANPEHEIVVDLAAQTFTPLKKWFDESAIIDIFNELGYNTKLWHVMDDGADSMFLLDRLLDTFAGQDVSLIVVQNYGRGNEFQHFEQSDVYKKALDARTLFVQLSALQPGLAKKIDFNNASFWNASNNGGMSIAERQRTKVWLKKHYAQIEGCVVSGKKPSNPLSQFNSPTVDQSQNQNLREPSAQVLGLNGELIYDYS